MSAPSSPLHPEGEDLLQAALSDAFTPPPLPLAPTSQPTPSPKPQIDSPPDHEPEPAVPPPPPSASALEHAAWQAEYDAQLAEWRRQSADARARAEQERARWEERRAAGGSDGWTSLSASSLSGPPHHGAPVSGSPSPVDVRDLVAGEAQGAPAGEVEVEAEAEVATASTGTQTAPPHSQSGHAQERSQTSSSPHWEDVPSSLTSSYPSLSFPDTSLPHSPSASHPSQSQHDEHASGQSARDAGSSAHAHPSRAHGDAAPSATLAIFDASLSARTRVWALVSSLGINLVLPFVNGVMLGFGEIFAKTVVVGWLGWRVPGGVGLGPQPVRKERK
ncbi:hypothetical protein FA95DRAFT_799213 [Auriscalpium vulgare]|uniref:Uncharacterized protein n=1 Tax=Auriscalpium vulgare TaxID=40419 RepID=A0ACB8S0Z2_9AGAM|nr:hypothetical protein FA95DRAFT_799213 [Auriscalpium vulgare]